MKRFWSYLQSGLLALVLAVGFTMTPVMALAVGYDNRPVTGVNKLVSMEAVTATYSDGTFNGTSGAIDDCSFFYLEPYTLDSTLDLIVQAGANSYTATHTYKIKAAAGNVAREFGPFYMDETDTSLNFYLAVTTNAAPAYSATIYVRGYRPAKHNY